MGPFICYEQNTSLFFHVFQMRLGSAFGAFLDPVADKVSLSSLI